MGGSEPVCLDLNETEPRLNILDWGGSGPPILLLHGLTGRSTGWREVAVRLHPKFRPVAMDLRGHGGSGRPDSGYDMQTLAGDALRVLDALGIERVHLIGHSLGGRIAFAFAAAFPQRVERLVIEEAHPAPYSGAGEAYTRRTAELLTRFPDRQAWANHLRATRGESSSRWYLQSLDGVDSEGAPRWAFSAKSVVMAAQESMETDSWGVFSAVVAPMLLLVGEHSDRDIGRYVERMKAVQGGMEVVTVTGTEHWIHGAAPDRYTALVEDFLRR